MDKRRLHQHQNEALKVELNLFLHQTIGTSSMVESLRKTNSKIIDYWL